MSEDFLHAPAWCAAYLHLAEYLIGAIDHWQPSTHESVGEYPLPDDWRTTTSDYLAALKANEMGMATALKRAGWRATTAEALDDVQAATAVAVAAVTTCELSKNEAAARHTIGDMRPHLGLIEALSQAPSSEPPPAESTETMEQYVTLDQVAALVNRSKKTLARKLNSRSSDAPVPDCEGGGGRPHEWKWSTIRPWLEKHFNRQLPERFPR